MFKMLKKYYFRMLLLVGFSKGNRQYVLLIFVDSHFPKFIIWFPQLSGHLISRKGLFGEFLLKYFFSMLVQSCPLLSFT